MRTLLAKSIVVSSLFLLSGYAEARNFRPDMIPNGNAFRCTNCHDSPFGAGPRTPFGEAVLEFVTIGGMEEFWNEALALADSDGDGITNGEELNDPAGTWRPGDADPGNPDDVTNPGALEVIEPPGTPFIRGDHNGDGQINISDPVATLNFLFSGGPGSSCDKSPDTNGDGQVNISDPVATLNFLFSGGPAPLGPHPDCGLEDEATELPCESFDSC